ncbi:MULTISPECIES: LysR family transcriptional regulator [unclassified Achromobacter]|uniref:LysR family transcriptional regulator n=1 Tax=unclassified Achromobacter TaxID=2626865 RepID=UPI000B51C601|nr:MULTISPECIES: LysR family transcriptional regulator [unclassified Achromobacter]OWT73635.1 LysR family transcriptional regulator [Achromobacter sp. HZ34]OWT79449.1 LysR family transcriptional regulator [Achromobacter sp. HZ28]
MPDRFESMGILVAVVEAGSFSAAARQLKMPLATVSRKVGELETHLQTRLLQRSTRRLTLTDTGLSYVAACRQILEQVGEAERAATGEYAVPRGELAITAPLVFGRLHLLPVVAEFLKSYPEIDVRLMLTDRTVHLVEEHIDIALRIAELPDSSLRATPIGLVRRVVCASPSYLAERGTPTDPRELGTHACITFEQMASRQVWTFAGSAAGAAPIAVPVHSRLAVSTAEAAVDAAVAGVGVTRVVSYQMLSALQSGALKIVLASYEPPPWPINLLHAREGVLPLKVRVFLDFAAPRLKARVVAAAV